MLDILTSRTLTRNETEKVRGRRLVRWNGTRHCAFVKCIFASKPMISSNSYPSAMPSLKCLSETKETTWNLKQ